MQSMKAPYLILCAEDDDLAPYQVICNFAQQLQELGGDVKVVTWNGSPHVGLVLNYLFFLIIVISIYITCNGCAETAVIL